MILGVAMAVIGMGHHALGVDHDHHGNGGSPIAAAFREAVVEQPEGVDHVAVFVRKQREVDFPELREALNRGDVIGRDRYDLEAVRPYLFNIFVPDDRLVNAGWSPRQ